MYYILTNSELFYSPLHNRVIFYIFFYILPRFNKK